jgi:hypothetical protein
MYSNLFQESDYSNNHDIKNCAPEKEPSTEKEPTCDGMFDKLDDEIITYLHILRPLKAKYEILYNSIYYDAHILNYISVREFYDTRDIEELNTDNLKCEIILETGNTYSMILPKSEFKKKK